MTGRISSLLAGGALAAACAALAIADDQPTLVGYVEHVADGDTIRLAGGARVRLHAIDAPELHQTCRDARGASWACGERARTMLNQMLREAGWRVTCEIKDKDRYGRLVGLCRTPDRRDLGARLVANGLALPYWKFGGSVYADHEKEAKTERLGMHADPHTPMTPEQYRREHRR